MSQEKRRRSNGSGNGDGEGLEPDEGEQLEEQERLTGAPGRPFTKGNEFRWRKGQSGNPTGRPSDPGLPAKYERMRPVISAELVEMWNQECDVKPFAGTGMTWGQVTLRSVFVNAIRGKSTALQTLFDRIWGKVPLAIKLTPPGSEDEDRGLLARMTDEELEQLEREEEAAAERERTILDRVRARLEGGEVIDVTPGPAK